MSPSNTILVQLRYGVNGVYSYDADPQRMVAHHAPPAENEHLAGDLLSALSRPIDFPPLSQAVVPGDRVVLAVDRRTPEVDQIVAAVWEVLQGRGVIATDVAILQPHDEHAAAGPDPRSRLPAEVGEAITWRIHNPSDMKAQAYLAATATGERVYLARELIDADLVVAIGSIGYDPVLGYGGTYSVLYPGLSTQETIQRSRGQGQRELMPADQRSQRQTIDEVAWLLGMQFAVQVIPAERGTAAHVLAGRCESVFRRATELLDSLWMVQLDNRCDIVVAAVDSGACPPGWEQIGAALESCRNLVVPGGKIVLLSEFRAELGRGLKILRDADNPREAIRPLRDAAPEDLIPASQMASAADWASVYLLSRLDADLVEDLGFIPVEKTSEIDRLLQSEGTYAFLGAAQHTFGRIRSS